MKFRSRRTPWSWGAVATLRAAVRTASRYALAASSRRPSWPRSLLWGLPGMVMRTAAPLAGLSLPRWGGAGLMLAECMVVGSPPPWWSGRVAHEGCAGVGELVVVALGAAGADGVLELVLV